MINKKPWYDKDTILETYILCFWKELEIKINNENKAKKPWYLRIYK